MKKISSIILRISITLALLVFLFSKTDFRSLSGVIRHCDAGAMLSAFLLFIFLNVLIILRWRLLLKGIGLSVPLERVSFSYLASLFFNLVLPSTIGGDAVRTLDIAGHTKSHSSGILATVVLDRVAGFFGLFTVLLAALIFGFRVFHEKSILLVTSGLFLLMAFLAGVMFSERFFKNVFGFLPFENVKKYLLKIHEATRSFKHKKRILIGAWLLSIVVQGGLSVMYYFLARAIGVTTGFIYFFLFVPVITVFSVLPISIGGLGVRDTTSIVLFAKVGVGASKAFAMSLLNFAFMLVLGLLGGFAYVISLYRRRV